jgi:hypothetical protein
MKSHEIWVNPVKRVSAQGRHKQVYSFIDSNNNLVATRSMDKIKEDNVTEIFQFPRNSETNKLVTGLDKQIENEFLGADPDELKNRFNLDESWDKTLSIIVTSPKIKKQTYYEILDGVTSNYYTNDTTHNITEPLNYKKGVTKNFLESFQVILYPRGNRFESNSQRGRLAIEMMKVLNRVANTQAAVNPSMHTWFISEENESIMESKKRRDIYKKAMHLMYELQNGQPDFELYKIGSILKFVNTEPVIRGKVSKNAVEEKIDQYLNDSSDAQTTYLTSFIELAEALNTSEGKVSNLIKYTVQQALNTGVISFRDGNYIWHSKSNQPALYKFTSDYGKLIAFFVREYNNFNPTDVETSNWFNELKNELINKDVRFE